MRRKLDNTAKIFSVEEKKYYNTFRLSIYLKEKVDSNLLKKATIEALKIYPSYGFRIKSGLFWNYLKKNLKELIIEEDKEIACKIIDFKKNNGFLFKVTYFDNKINIDFCHVLTDGLGAIIFLKGILYNYLNLKYNLETTTEEVIRNIKINQDEHIENADKKLVCKETQKKSFLIEDESNLLSNKTYHYILDLEKFKNICKKDNVTITEYLTSLYIYAIYKTLYNNKSDKDIILTIPVELRKIYNVESFSNFFTCMSISANVVNDQNVTLDKILKQVHEEFKSKLKEDNIKKYLSRDVKLGTNIGIKFIPLIIKKVFMKYLGKYVSNPTTTTISNIGSIDIEEQYKKYIDNIVAFVTPGKIQKVKCTICSYENNLIVTINSNLTNNKFEKEFYDLLNNLIGNVKVVGDKINII